MKRFFKNLFGGKATAKNTTKSAFKPSFEALEERKLMAVQVGDIDLNGDGRIDAAESRTLNVVGTEQRDIVELTSVTRRGQPTVLTRVTIKDEIGNVRETRTVNTLTFDRINADLRGGDDDYFGHMLLPSHEKPSQRRVPERALQPHPLGFPLRRRQFPGLPGPTHRVPGLKQFQHLPREMNRPTPGPPSAPPRPGAEGGPGTADAAPP
jgi:hypothetical protein